MLRDRGWHQCALLSANDATRLSLTPPLTERLYEADFLIAVTHDCDILNRDLNKEPYVEFIIAQRCEHVAGDLMYGKNPRRLIVEHAGEHLELDVHQRHRVPREELQFCTPVAELTGRNRQLLRRWLANRYARAAFPDAFNDRIASALPKIHKALKASGHNLSGIYLGLQEKELSANEDYIVFVHAGMPTELYDELSLREACQEVVGLVAAELAGCKGIDVANDSLRPESQFTLDDLRVIKRWDYDSLSFRSERVGAFAPNNEG
jgi:hypothetical protein